MDDDAPHRLRWPRVLSRVIGYPLLALVLYVLSLGPVGYLLSHRSDRLDRAIIAFYLPFDLLMSDAHFSHPLFRYSVWWYELPGGPGERWLRKATPLPASQDLPLDAPVP